MEITELSTYLREGDPHKKIEEQVYWRNIWDKYVEETRSMYSHLTTKEAMVRMISEVNFRKRSQSKSSEDLGVWTRVGDICYIDYGINYINEAGFQHFGIILAIVNNKALVTPMTSNERAYHISTVDEGRPHLMPIGKIDGMYRESTLFLNDTKFINSARIIDVKAHLDVESELFKEIKKRFHELVGK